MIHPRKEQDDALLNINSVFGTAKATQEADNVLILQKVDGNKLIDIRKNRFDGDLGRFQIIFDQETHLYRDELSDEVKTIGEYEGGVVNHRSDDDGAAATIKGEGVVGKTDRVKKKKKEPKEMVEEIIVKPELDEIIMS